MNRKRALEIMLKWASDNPYEFVSEIQEAYEVLKHDINQTPSLDNELEEALDFFRMDEGDAAISYEMEGYPIEEQYRKITKQWNIIKEGFRYRDNRIERQDKRIKELNDMLEVDTIAEILDLIKNNKPIPLNRKELLSIINSIEEVISYDTNTSDFSRCALDEIKIILERLQKWTIG